MRRESAKWLPAGIQLFLVVTCSNPLGQIYRHSIQDVRAAAFGFHDTSGLENELVPESVGQRIH